MAMKLTPQMKGDQHGQRHVARRQNSRALAPTRDDHADDDGRRASDQPRQLLHARVQPFAGEIGEIGRQGQDRPCLSRRAVRARQDAGHGGGDDIGDALDGAENARPVHQARRGEAADLRADVLVHGRDGDRPRPCRDRRGPRGRRRRSAYSRAGSAQVRSDSRARCASRCRRTGRRRGAVAFPRPSRRDGWTRMKASLQAIRSSPWPGERERRRLYSRAASISGSRACNFRARASRKAGPRAGRRSKSQPCRACRAG